MFGVSTFCLHQESLISALDKISSISDYIEVMDEGLHYLESAEPLMSYTKKFSIHAPSRGTNIASLLEPIRKASVEVICRCFRIAAEVNAGVVIHPGYFAWAEERIKAERQLKISLSDLSDFSREYSVRYYIENMGNWDYFFLKTPAGTVPYRRYALCTGCRSCTPEPLSEGISCCARRTLPSSR